MSALLTEDDVLASLSGLTRDRLIAFIAAEVIVPLHSGTGPVFRQIDIARLQLLCELSDDLDLDDHAVSIVMSLIDQLHDARIALRALTRAVADAPDDLRAHVNAALRQAGL